MNYKIKSTDGSTLSIDGQLIDGNPIDLVTLNCLNSNNYNPLFNGVKAGLFTIQLQGVDVEGVPVVSKLIQLDIDGKESKDKYLNQDWVLKSRANGWGVSDSNVINIDASYDKRILDGQAYYRVKRAELVNEILLGNITSQDAFIIDQKIKEVRNSLLFGDWKSARYYIELTTVEGAYTQDIKNTYSSELDTYISANY